MKRVSPSLLKIACFLVFKVFEFTFQGLLICCDSGYGIDVFSHIRGRDGHVHVHVHGHVHVRGHVHDHVHDHYHYRYVMCAMCVRCVRCSFTFIIKNL